MKKTNFKKITSLFLAFLLMVTIVLPINTTKAKAEENVKTFDIIEITDFHGTLEDTSGNPVAAVLAKNISDIKNSNPERTLILGCGDLYQGSPMSNFFKGVPVQKVLSNIGMEVTTVGNHEFDWGLDTIINTTMKDAKYSMICANLYDKTTGKRVFEPYKIIEKDGIKIGIIGAISTETPTIVLPKFVENYEFKDVAVEINSLVKEVKDKGADVVLALIHEGDRSDKIYPSIYDIADKLEGVDAVFGGHSHTIANTKSSKGIPVMIANNAGKGFIDAKMTIGSDKKVSFSANYIDIYTDKPNGYKAPNPIIDSQVKAIVDEAKKEIEPTFGVVIGKADSDLTRKQICTNKWSPYGESYLGNWITDVIKNKVNADVGMQNNGGIRIDVPKGDITVGTINYIMPFDNTICVINMNKAQIKKVLEQAVMDGGKGIQISGLKVKYDYAKPSMSRVVDIVRENGTPISDSEILKVATNDFMATGGDGFTGFVDAGGKDPKVNTFILVRDALIENVKSKGKVETVLNSRLTDISKAISIIGTSDIHGNIYPLDYYTGKAADQGLAKVSTYVKDQRKANPNVMLVDAGDTIQGTPLAYYYNKMDTKSEYPMIKAMGIMKYDTWTLGNHEFNYGLENLDRIIKDANNEGITVLSANTYKIDGTNYVKPYIIKSFNINGKTQKIAVLGLTTKTIPSWENEANYKGLKFNDLVDEAKKWVPIIKSEGIDKIIAVIHSGEESSSDIIPENQIKAVAQGVSGIDAIICGHTHKNIAQNIYKNPDGKNVIVTEPGKNGQYISQVDIYVDSEGNIGQMISKNVKMDSAVAADKELMDAMQTYQDKTMDYIDTVIGKSTGEYSGKEQTIKPTALMDLVNEVQRTFANTQLSIAAPLSLSAYIPSGDIKIKDIMSVYVYENFLYGIKMNGKQIKDWLEWSVRYYKQVSKPDDKVEKDPELNIPDYNLDMLYGATYDIDITQPIGQRIKNLKYNGRLIKDTDVFTVAINNYRFNGGGGFMAAAGLKPGDMSIVVYDSAKLLGDDGQVRSMMIDYIKNKGTISPTISKTWTLYTTNVEQTEEAPVKTVKVVALKGLRIRAAANVSSKILGVYKNGTEVVVEGEVGNWYKINYNGLKGYIYKKYTK